MLRHPWSPRIASTSAADRHLRLPQRTTSVALSPYALFSLQRKATGMRHRYTSPAHIRSSMARSLTLFVLASFVWAGSLQAQIAFGGHPYGDKAVKYGMPPSVAVHLPSIDVDALMAEDAANAAQGIKGPFRFGFTHATAYDLNNSGSWWTMPNGDRVWRLTLNCPGAIGINLAMDRYVIPTGARVYLYNEAGRVLGAFTAESNPGHTALGTAPLSGESITVEYIEPDLVAGQGQLNISGVTHEYRRIGAMGADRGFGDSGDCNVNTICPEGDEWRPEIRSVAELILGGGSCSGTLLNNCANDSTPYFLTANHCTEGNTTNATWVFIFNWESPTCDTTQNASTDHSITGCDVLAESGATDVSFLRLSSTPPEEFLPYFSGWDKSGTAPDSVHCIHHPAGDIKKISSSHGPIVEGVMGVADCWQVTEWHSGTTEPGSSGSALWNQDHRIIGQLFGGEASCSNNVNDFFGRFSLSYPLLEEWLGTCGDTLDGFDPSLFVPVPIDIAITSIYNVDLNVCGMDSITPTVTLKNNGEDVLSIAQINWQVDGTFIGSQPWFGPLMPMQTTNVQLPAIHVSNGQHVLRISTSGPNNTVDDNLLNDADSITFMVNDPALMSTVQMDLDQFGVETTWEMETDQGLLVYSGGPYSNTPQGYTVNTELCLAHACYVFTVFDAVDDGMCCTYGNGDYRILSSEGDTLLEGNGTFGASRSDAFCVNWVGIPEAESLRLQVFPNPSSGQVVVRAPNEIAPKEIRVLDPLGRMVWREAWTNGAQQMDLDLHALGAGSYILVVESPEHRAVQRLILQH